MAVHLLPVVNVQHQQEIRDFFDLFLFVFFFICCKFVGGIHLKLLWALSLFIPSFLLFLFLGGCQKNIDALCSSRCSAINYTRGRAVKKQTNKQTTITQIKRSHMHLCLMGVDSPLGASAQFVTGLTFPADCQRRRVSPR